MQAGLLIEVEGTVEYFSFAHGLTQHTLYEDLGATRRARVHRKIAEVLEELSGAAPESRAAELARHFVAATKAADATKALTYSKLAGEQALAQLAPADALGWFSQGLELFPQVPPDERLRCDLLIGLGTAQRRTGDPAHRQVLLDAAASAAVLGDRNRLVAAALANSRGGFSVAGLVDHDKSAVLEQALVAVGPGDSPERARLLRSWEPSCTGGQTETGGRRSSRNRSPSPVVSRTLFASCRSSRTSTGTILCPTASRVGSLTSARPFRSPTGTEISKPVTPANYQRALTCLQVADARDSTAISMQPLH